MLVYFSVHIEQVMILYKYDFDTLDVSWGRQSAYLTSSQVMQAYSSMNHAEWGGSKGVYYLKYSNSFII